MPLAFDCESPANQLGALSPDSTRDEQNPQLLGIVIDKQEGHCAICLENVDLVADSSKIHHCTICKQPFHLYCSGPWLKLHGRCAHCQGADARAKEVGYVEPSPETSQPSLTELQHSRRLFNQGRTVVAQSTSGPPTPCEGMLTVSVVFLLGLISTVLYLKGQLR
ncbi:hypothetical protein PGTUg99_005886 [Puccinia graminis f. sp. tritici]|uniref:RING-type domain-containing protein n=1 Tax=Puccinia graminis f. sp. tritici TaxID=56615 RepID=A0A5B0QDX3_PUCGR|nr:hypothetical protein PGTUg99_005886 [Puccinia graminis f. sp. tritici]